MTHTIPNLFCRGNNGGETPGFGPFDLGNETGRRPEHPGSNDGDEEVPLGKRGTPGTSSAAFWLASDESMGPDRRQRAAPLAHRIQLASLSRQWNGHGTDETVSVLNRVMKM
jgi:hypothetical protein